VGLKQLHTSGSQTQIHCSRSCVVSLQFFHVRSFACRGRLPNLKADYSTVRLCCVTITWQQIYCSLQVTIVGLLPHVTNERRHLGRKCNEAVTANSGKQGRRRAGHCSLTFQKRANRARCLVNNSIIHNFMVYQDRIEAKFSDSFFYCF